MISLLLTLILGFASDLCNNKDIILILGYNYNQSCKGNRESAFQNGYVYIAIYISYNTGKSALPDIYARCQRVHSALG